MALVWSCAEGTSVDQQCTPTFPPPNFNEQNNSDIQLDTYHEDYYFIDYCNSISSNSPHLRPIQNHVIPKHRVLFLRHPIYHLPINTHQTTSCCKRFQLFLPSYLSLLLRSNFMHTNYSTCINSLFSLNYVLPE